MKKYAFLLLVLLVIMSCNKKPTVTLGRADMLRAGKWLISSGTVTLKLPSGKDTTLNYMNFIPLCHHDDYIIFHSGTDAAIFSGPTKCNPGEPDSTTFQWSLSNNDNAISFYSGYTFTYGIVDTILPFVFDTTSQSPLVLDTLYGVNDTTFGYTRSLIVLDTFWNLKFDSSALQYNQVSNAQITNFSATSFTINYWIYTTYPDSSNYHTYRFPVPGSTDTLDYNPIMRPDTVKYSVTYKNG